LLPQLDYRSDVSGKKGRWTPPTAAEDQMTAGRPYERLNEESRFVVAV
jgi:hypothetical protein